MDGSGPHPMSTLNPPGRCRAHGPLACRDFLCVSRWNKAPLYWISCPSQLKPGENGNESQKRNFNLGTSARGFDEHHISFVTVVDDGGDLNGPGAHRWVFRGRCEKNGIGGARDPGYRN